MLLQIREFFRREKIASNQQVARFFQIDGSALEPMLAIWLHRGVLAYASQQGPAFSCASACGSSCQSQSIVYYVFCE